MSVATVDNKKRITLKDAAPGEVYDVTYIGGGYFRLARMKREPDPKGERSNQRKKPPMPTTKTEIKPSPFNWTQSQCVAALRMQMRFYALRGEYKVAAYYRDRANAYPIKLKTPVRP